TSIEKVVVEADPLGSKKSTDVGADARRLAGLIDNIYGIDCNTVGTGHTEYRIADGWIAEPCIRVEDRRDEHWRNDSRDQLECDVGDRCPKPPESLDTAKNSIQCRDSHRAKDKCQSQRF